MNHNETIDAQIAVSKRHPRNIMRCIENSIALATMDQDTARSCSYTLFRDGKFITGPSVHLAKIIASNWGNLHSEANIVRRTDKEITSRGTCWDLEANVSTLFEVSRSIVDHRGRKYPEDIIVSTGNAVNSISFRNAVFAVIPKAITDKVYQAAQKFITGDLSDESKLNKVRSETLDSFRKTYKIKEEEILRLCSRQSVEQITSNDLSTLIGILQSLKDGDTTIEDIKSSIGSQKEKVEEKKKVIKQKKAPELP